MPTFTAGRVAERVSGTLSGDGERRISGVASVETAGPSDVTYVVEGADLEAVLRSEAGAVLVPAGLPVPETGDPAERPTLIRVERPRLAFREAVLLFHPPRPAEPGVADSAAVAADAHLEPYVSVGEFSVIRSGARIGAETRIGAHTVVGEGAEIGGACEIGDGCTVGPGVRLGDRVVLHPGVRVGTEGFGYLEGEGDEGAVRMPHVGGCVIGDDVEIGANSTVDRGTLEDTVIGSGTKIDNLVHVGHNVRIGRRCFIVAQAGVAGSVEVGDGVKIGGQAGISDHVRVGDGARIAAQAGVIGDVPAGETYSGYPARPHRTALRASAALFRLPELVRRLRRLEDERDEET